MKILFFISLFSFISVLLISSRLLWLIGGYDFFRLGRDCMEEICFPSFVHGLSLIHKYLSIGKIMSGLKNLSLLLFITNRSMFLIKPKSILSKQLSLIIKSTMEDRPNCLGIVLIWLWFALSDFNIGKRQTGAGIWVSLL